MKKILFILMTILVLFTNVVNALYFDEVTITNPNGTDIKIIRHEINYTSNDVEVIEKEEVLHIPCNETIQLVDSEPTEDGYEDYISGYYNKEWCYVLQKDTSIADIPNIGDSNSDSDNKDGGDKHNVLLWVIIIAVAVIVIIIWSNDMALPQCPKCKARNSRETKREFLNSEKVYFKEEERVKEYSNKGKYRSNTMHKASTNQYVNPPDKILVKEKLIEGTREYYRVTYKCNKCGETFTQKEYVDRKPKII